MIREAREADGEILVDDVHRLGHLHLDRREVPDALDAGFDELVRHVLRKSGGHGDDADVDAAFAHDA